MQGTILLNYDTNIQQFEDEERARFLHFTLEQMGVPLQDVWEQNDQPPNTQERIKLRNILSAYNIQVLDDKEVMDIFVEGEKVGTWNKPNYILKKDGSQLDKRKQLYLEATLTCWSIFEEETDG